MRLVALALALLSACAGQPYVATNDGPTPVENMIAHTVLLEDPGCTGIRIGGGKVLTAKHCMDDHPVGSVYTGFTVEYIDAHSDFAVLSGDAPATWVTMPDASEGERVYVVGYGMDINDGKQRRATTDGVYTGVEIDDSSGVLQRITAFAYYGNSGGGVWNERGDLVGILVQGRFTGATYNGYPVPFPCYQYMVPIRFVREVL